MSSEGEKAFAKANELYVEESFEEAAALYDEAVRSNSSNASYYLHRSANFIKLRKYKEAATDADACLKIDAKNNTAFLRKGIAQFYLDQFQDAKRNFEVAAKLGNPNTKLWLRKCDAELRDAGMDTTTTESDSKSDAPMNPVTEPVAQKPAVVASNPSPPVNPAVKDSWYQNLENVTITLFAKGMKPGDVTTKFDSRSLDVEMRLPDGTEYRRTWNLFAQIVPSLSSKDVTPFKVEISLKKSVAENWEALEAKVTEAVRRANTHDGKIAAYPTSSKKGTDVNWDQMAQQQKKEEEDEPASGDAGLQKLFQKIYSDGDEATRRAMIKSYQTSGGTVLSTNWKEVEKRDYEKEGITPPSGMEVRKREI